MTQVTDTTTVVELAKWFPTNELPESAKARLFGELVKRATPIVEHYVSDLYHDSQWITKHVSAKAQPFITLSFYYCIDDYGTHIGTDDTILEHRKTAQFKVTLINHDQVWSAVFEDITPKE